MAGYALCFSNVLSGTMNFVSSQIRANVLTLLLNLALFPITLYSVWIAVSCYMIAIFLVAFCIGLYDPPLGAGLPVIRVCGFMMGTVLVFSYVPYYDITNDFKSELDPSIYDNFYQAPPVQAFVSLLFASKSQFINIFSNRRYLDLSIRSICESYRFSDIF